jgi:GntR family transcriptional regulator
VDIVLSPANGKPIYEQIRSQIAAQILSGDLAAGYCLPSIRIVAAELGISVITVKKAWELLEADDLIYTQAGRGCFVAEHKAGKLEDKRLALAAEQFRKDAAYYKNLHISLEELLEIARQEYARPASS